MNAIFFNKPDFLYRIKILEKRCSAIFNQATALSGYFVMRITLWWTKLQNNHRKEIRALVTRH